MEIKILNEEKNLLELEIENLTIAEILRVYLNKEGSKMAVWKRPHPSSAPTLHIEGDSPKKILKKAIDSIKKDLDKQLADFKKLK